MSRAGGNSAGEARTKTQSLLRGHGLQSLRRRAQHAPGRGAGAGRTGDAAAVATVRQRPRRGLPQPGGASDAGQLLREGLPRRRTGLLLQVSVSPRAGRWWAWIRITTVNRLISPPFSSTMSAGSSTNIPEHSYTSAYNYKPFPVNPECYVAL